LINVGRLDRQKAQDILAQALAMTDLAARKAKMVLIGGASESARAAKTEDFATDLRNYVQQKGLADRLIFAGWRNDVPALLQAADAYIHSARWEGFPLAPLEAMAASKPCVWTDCSGHPEGFVEGTHGWVAAKEDPQSLRQAIERMLDLSPEQRTRMGLACRELAESRYDIQKVGARFVEMVEAHSLN
jgi:glycosyltransferase involved in cell wall biosynthesis